MFYSIGCSAVVQLLCESYLDCTGRWSEGLLRKTTRSRWMIERREELQKRRFKKMKIENGLGESSRVGLTFRKWEIKTERGEFRVRCERERLRSRERSWEKMSGNSFSLKKTKEREWETERKVKRDLQTERERAPDSVFDISPCSVDKGCHPLVLRA